MPGITKAGGGWNDRTKADLVGRVLSGALSVQEACAKYGLSVECLRDWMLVFRRSAVRAFDEHLRDTLFAQGVEVSAMVPAGFTGSLSDIAIADLVQTMTLGRRDSVITVSHDGNESRIWCTGGEIVDAESGRLRGKPALYRALALEQGQVVADFCSTHRTRTIVAPTAALLLDAARRTDECRRLKERLGPVRYVVGPRVMAADATFSPGEREILREFYAANAIADALARAETGDLESLRAISQLVAKDYLVPERALALPSTPPPSAPAATSLSPTVLSFFGTAQRRPRTAPGSRKRALVSVAALGALGLAGWLASAGGQASSSRRSLATSPPPLGAAGAAPSKVHEPEPAVPTRTDEETVASDAGLLGSELVHAASKDGAARRPATRVRAEIGAATPSPRATSAGSAQARDSTLRSSASREAEGRSAASDAARAPLPRMQIIEEQPLRMEIVE